MGIRDVGKGRRRIKRDQQDLADEHWVQDKIKVKVIPRNSSETVSFERTFDFHCSKMPTSFYFRFVFTRPCGEGVSCVTSVRRTDQGTKWVNVQLLMLIGDGRGYFAGTLNHFFPPMESGADDKHNSEIIFISEEDAQDYLHKRMLVEFILRVKYCHSQQSIPEDRTMGKEAMDSRDSRDSVFQSQPDMTQELAGGEDSESYYGISPQYNPKGRAEEEDSEYSVTSPQHSPSAYLSLISPQYIPLSPQSNPKGRVEEEDLEYSPSTYLSLKSPQYTPLSPTSEKDSEHSSPHSQQDIPECRAKREYSPSCSQQDMPEDRAEREHSIDSSSHSQQEMLEGRAGREDSKDSSFHSQQARPIFTQREKIHKIHLSTVRHKFFSTTCRRVAPREKNQKLRS